MSSNASIRFASFNASLNRSSEGELISDLSTPDNVQAQAIACDTPRSPDNTSIHKLVSLSDRTSGLCALQVTLVRSSFRQASANADLLRPHVLV